MPRDDPLEREARAALARAIRFFREQVAVQGGYVWRYSEELSRREGEDRAGPTTLWVQPPGTPAVGMAMLAAFEATGDREHLEGARAACLALLRGQLESGGWTYRIELDPADRARVAYRWGGGGGQRARNISSLDDDTTQSALRCLMRVDRALAGGDPAIREGAQFALKALLRAQFPNGGWPQGFAGPPPEGRYAPRPASYPDSWPRVCPGGDYWHFATLNDNNLQRLVETLFEAAGIYGNPEFRAAAARAGEFLLQAQMPAPQPAWAQQYDFEMHPTWARRFEPPAISGGESQGVMRSLLHVAAEMRDTRYCEPIPRALEYLRRSRLPDGRLARFYELRTNRPLYFTRSYELTYDDSDLPTHYAFRVSDGTAGIARDHDRLRAAIAEGKAPAPPGRRRPRRPAPERVRQVIAALDARGAWVEEGRLRHHGPDDSARRIIDCGRFIENVGVLCDFLRGGDATGERSRD